MRRWFRHVEKPLIAIAVVVALITLPTTAAYSYQYDERYNGYMSTDGVNVQAMCQQSKVYQDGAYDFAWAYTDIRNYTGATCAAGFRDGYMAVQSLNYKDGSLCAASSTNQNSTAMTEIYITSNCNIGNGWHSMKGTSASWYWDYFNGWYGAYLLDVSEWECSLYC